MRRVRLPHSLQGPRPEAAGEASWEDAELAGRPGGATVSTAAEADNHGLKRRDRPRRAPPHGWMRRTYLCCGPATAPDRCSRLTGWRPRAFGFDV